MESYKTPEQISIPHSLELAKELEGIEDEVVLKEKLSLLMDYISEDLGIEFTDDVNTLYKGMNSENCLVRVEQLSRVLRAVELNETLSISDKDESHYANAVLPIPAGIKIAFSEGQAPGPIRTAIGFGKTIIGFKTGNISVEEIEYTHSEIRDHAERKQICRHVVGDLRKEDIRYLVMRIPRHLLDDQHLSEKEKKSKTPFVFRGLKM